MLFATIFQLAQQRYMGTNTTPNERYRVNVARVLFFGNLIEEALGIIKYSLYFSPPTLSHQPTYDNELVPSQDAKFRQLQVSNDITKRIPSTWQYSVTKALHKNLATYNYAWKDVGLTPEEKLQFLHYFFTRVSLINSRSHIKRNCKTFAQSIDRLLEGLAPNKKQ